MATVHLPRSLVAILPGAERRMEVPGGTVASVVDALDARAPGLRNRVLDAGPSIREHLNVFVDGERADLATPVGDGSTVPVIPAVSGGRGRPSEDGRARDGALTAGPILGPPPTLR